MDEPLSEHCSLMAKPGGPPKAQTQPADCPKDGIYIKTAAKNGGITLPPGSPFPIVVEGGDGNDSVTVIGPQHMPITVSGGKGDDNITVKSEWIWAVDKLTPTGVLFLAALLIVLATLAVIVWRALAPRDLGYLGSG